MTTIETIFTTNEGQIVNVIQFKESANSKIGQGLVIQTYHFSIEQIINNNLSLDSKNCLDCPLSYSSGHKLGSCYTHKGMQLFGLNSMLKKLHKLNNKGLITEFNNSTLNAFISRVQSTINKKGQFIKLVRFGAYGEPIFLGEDIISKLAKLGKNITGYTHQYNKDKYHWANKFFMASTHGAKDMAIATNRNFRQFNVLLKTDIVENSVNCPSSKEFEQLKGKKVSCVNCSLCSGNYKNIKKNVHILVH